MYAHLIGLVVAVIAEPIEARGRSAGNKRAGLEPADGGPLTPDWDKHLGDRAVRRDDNADHQQRSKRDRRTDLTEETRCGLGDSASDEPAGDVVVHVMTCQPEKRDDNDEPAEYRQHGLAADEPEPELERDRPEREGHEPRRPPKHREERRTPPLQHRALIRRERDRRQEGERDDRDRTDLVADARLHRRCRASAPRACCSARHRPRPA